MTAEEEFDGPPWTPEQLADRRKESIEFIIKSGHGLQSFTCDGCDFAPQCDFAFDPYNTDGDCLEMK